MDVTRIGFYNNGREDETEFDTIDEQEIAELWYEFCKEEGIIAYVEQEDDGYEPPEDKPMAKKKASEKKKVPAKKSASKCLKPKVAIKKKTVKKSAAKKR